ncbi:MAG: copper chaperone PCu(A)C [Paracoccaceae bacterium]
MLSRRFLLAAAAALTLTPAFSALAEEHPETFHAHDVYGRTMGSVGASGAIFLMLHNNGTTDDRLIGATTDVAQKAELHTHTMTDDGVMQMHEIEGGVPMPAGEMHSFERGADHIMLMGLTRELKDGDTFPMVLQFESGAQLTIEVVIDNERKADAAPEGEMQMEGEMKMDDHDHSTMD